MVLGGPLIDTLDLFPEQWDFTFWGGRGCSRCDAILITEPSSRYVRSFKVLSEIRDGGHCPIELGMNIKPLRINWFPPRRQPPECLRRTLSDLRASEDHQDLLRRWKDSEAFRKLAEASPEELGAAVKSALDELISLAGGWECRTRRPKKAYDSQVVRAHP